MFPMAKETSAVVAETLLKHIIPRFGVPLSIQSDNGPAFISQVTQQVSEVLPITWSSDPHGWIDSPGPYYTSGSPLTSPLNGAHLSWCVADPSWLSTSFLQSLLPWLTVYLIWLWFSSFSENTQTCVSRVLTRTHQWTQMPFLSNKETPFYSRLFTQTYFSPGEFDLPQWSFPRPLWCTSWLHLLVPSFPSKSFQNFYHIFVEGATDRAYHTNLSMSKCIPFLQPY